MLSVNNKTKNKNELMIHFNYPHLAESVKRRLQNIICLHVCLHWNDRENNAAYPDTNSSNDTALNSQELEPLPPYMKCGQAQSYAVYPGSRKLRDPSLRNLILSSSLLLIHSHAAKQDEATGLCMSIAQRALAAVPSLAVFALLPWLQMGVNVWVFRVDFMLYCDGYI